MRERKSIFRWLIVWLLLVVLGVGALGRVGLSVSAAPRRRPPASCSDLILTQWTFTNNVLTPSTGTGTLNYGSGLTGGPSYVAGYTTDPALSFTGWNSSSLDANDYYEFRVDTTGRHSIGLNFQSRASATGPTILDVYYSIDGANFTILGTSQTLENDANWHSKSFDFSTVPALEENPNAVFRLYGYAASGAGGTWRIDDVTFTGNCGYTPLSVIISEVAWAGTKASVYDEWIELYNPGSSPIDLTGWKIEAKDGDPSIPLTGNINAGGFYLLERSDSLVTDVVENQVYNGGLLSDTGETLYLFAPDRTIVDTANSSGGAWPAGGGTNFSSMERVIKSGVVEPDGKFAWITNVGIDSNGNPTTATDAAGNQIFGTPGVANWAFTVGPTATPAATKTPAPFAFLSVAINEVAWAGTKASSDDEWIELYNPGSADIDLTGWKLEAADGSPNITLSGTIQAGGYFLLERTDDDTVENVAADLIYSGALSNSGEILRLYDPTNRIIDTANSNGGAWPAGSSATYSSMERGALVTDSDRAWVTYYSAATRTDIPLDSGGNEILGTPGSKNLPFNVTATAVPVTAYPTYVYVRGTPVPVYPGGAAVPLPILGISEFLPRPGHDWNNDGKVDVFDEFIEIINAGQVDVNLRSYQLDDEQGQGSPAYTLPNVTLKAGDRAVFYASETGINLSDAGDTVRLLSGGKVVDAYTYGPVRFPDEAWCRVPDRLGYWNEPCFPTPGNPNALTGTYPQPPGSTTGYHAPLCLLPDTTPEEFVYGECQAGGDGIWNRQYWDGTGFFEWVIPSDSQKWNAFVE